MKRLVALALVLSMGACSFVSMERLPSGYRVEQTPRCSTTRVAPYADIAGGGWFWTLTALGIYTIAKKAPEERTGSNYAVVSGYATVAASFTGSYVWGRRQKARCERARAEHDGFVARGRTAP